MYLASIVGIHLAAEEYIDSFKVETWGVTYKAVCHIPPGWRVKAGSSATPDGEIEGEASHGVTFLNRRSLGQLRGLVLLTLYDRVQRHDVGHLGANLFIPSTFKGSATVGTYGGDDKGRKATLTSANVRLVRANRCPPPHD